MKIQKEYDGVEESNNSASGKKRKGLLIFYVFLALLLVIIVVVICWFTFRNRNHKTVKQPIKPLPNVPFNITTSTKSLSFFLPTPQKTSLLDLSITGSSSYTSAKSLFRCSNTEPTFYFWITNTKMFMLPSHLLESIEQTYVLDLTQQATHLSYFDPFVPFRQKSQKFSILDKILNAGQLIKGFVLFLCTADDGKSYAFHISKPCMWGVKFATIQEPELILLNSLPKGASFSRLYTTFQGNQHQFVVLDNCIILGTFNNVVKKCKLPCHITSVGTCFSSSITGPLLLYVYSYNSENQEARFYVYDVIKIFDDDQSLSLVSTYQLPPNDDFMKNNIPSYFQISPDGLYVYFKYSVTLDNTEEKHLVLELDEKLNQLRVLASIDFDITYPFLPSKMSCAAGRQVKAIFKHEHDKKIPVLYLLQDGMLRRVDWNNGFPLFRVESKIRALSKLDGGDESVFDLFPLPDHNGNLVLAQINMSNCRIKFYSFDDSLKLLEIKNNQDTTILIMKSENKKHVNKVSYST